MDGQAIIAVSAACVAITQISKWAGLPDRYGPIAVLLYSFIGVCLWGYSVGTFERAQAFTYFAGWIAVSTSAAGVFGFTRAGGEGITAIKAPPTGGAGSSKTIKGNKGRREVAGP
jgi:O-antigen/teichoic acid export membrane protein